MRIRKKIKGILRQGLTAIFLVILFFIVINLTGLGVEKIESEKIFSEYIRSKDISSFNYTKVADISNDFSKLMLAKDGGTNKDGEIIKIISLWNIYKKDEPEFILEKKFIKYEKAYCFSPDFTIYARLNKGHCIIRKTKDDDLINKIMLSDTYLSKDDSFAINNKNNRIAIVKNNDNDSILYIYDIQSGKKIVEKTITGLYYSADLIDFSFDDKYLIIYTPEEQRYYNIFSVEKDSFVYKIVSDEDPFIKQKDLLIANDTYDVKIVDLAKAKLKNSLKMDSGDNFNLNPTMYTEDIGNGKSILDNSHDKYFNETISARNKIINRKRYYVEDQIRRNFYDYNKNRWIIVGEENIHYITAANDRSNKIAEDYLKAVELIEYGFKEGVEKLKQAIASENIIGFNQNYGKFLNPEYDLTLKQRAELILAEYKSLMTGDSRGIIGIDFEFSMSARGYKIKSISNYSDLNRYPEIKEGALITAVNAKAVIPGRDLRDYYSSFKPGEKITLTIKQKGIEKDYDLKLLGEKLDFYNTYFATNKLFVYGLLAARAGYPQLSLEAAEQIKKLQLLFPIWDDIDKQLIVLEALAIAARDGSEAGYSYLVDNDGIRNNKKDSNYFIYIYLDDYPEYFAPLLADRKKMAYFTKRTENELPSAQIWQPEKLDFIDLAGNEIAGVEAYIGASFKNEAEDKKNSNSVGTVLD